jgi:hypothetical protein
MGVLFSRSNASTNDSASKNHDNARVEPISNSQISDSGDLPQVAAQNVLEEIHSPPSSAKLEPSQIKPELEKDGDSTSIRAEASRILQDGPEAVGSDQKIAAKYDTDVLEAAKQLELDVTTEGDLMWIADRYAHSMVSPPWVIFVDQARCTQSIISAHLDAKLIVRQSTAVSHFPSLCIVPAQSDAGVAQNGGEYYYNGTTQTTQWEHPYLADFRLLLQARSRRKEEMKPEGTENDRETDK